MTGKISLVVHTGQYPSVRSAVVAMKQADWREEESPDCVICRECFGTLDLQKYLMKMSPDTEFELCSAIPGEGEAIVIGKMARRLAGEWGILGEEEKIYKWEPDSYKIVTTIQRGRSVTLLWGCTSRAVLYAVNGYMEALGIRFFSPSGYGTYIPHKDRFTLPDIHKKDSPSFKTRGCYSELLDDSNDEFLDWLMHHNVNFVYLERYDAPWKLKIRGIQVCMGGHSLLHQFLSPVLPYPYTHFDDPYPLSSEAVYPQRGEIMTYYHAHPEWYGLINGIRSPSLGVGDVEGAGDNFCTSNKDAVKELCKNIVSGLIDGQYADADYLNFWMLDNGRWCQCPECKKIGNKASRLSRLVYELNKTIQKARIDGKLKRDIKILFPAYHETLPVPDQALPEDFDYEHCIVTCFPIERCYVHHLDDPGCTETNKKLYQNMKAWACDEERNYKGELFIGEYYNVSSFASISVSFREKMTYELPMYYRMGTRHMYYMHMTAWNWGTLTPSNYLFYSMLWNEGLDTDNYMNEYFDLYYRESAGVMKAFYETLELGSSNMKYFKHYQFLYEGNNEERLALFVKLNQGKAEEAELFPLQHMKYNFRAEGSNGGIDAVSTIDAYENCRKLLEQAFYCCESLEVEQRLIEDAERFEYTLLSLRYSYHMTRLAVFHGRHMEKLASWEYGTVKQIAGKLREITKPLMNLLHFTQYQNGLSATWAEAALEHYSNIYEERTSYVE